MPSAAGSGRRDAGATPASIPAGPVLAQPYLRPVDVGIDGLAEAVVQGDDHLRAGAPHRGRHQSAIGRRRLSLPAVVPQEALHLGRQLVGASRRQRLSFTRGRASIEVIAGGVGLEVLGVLQLGHVGRRVVVVGHPLADLAFVLTAAARSSTGSTGVPSSAADRSTRARAALGDGTWWT